MYHENNGPFGQWLASELDRIGGNAEFRNKRAVEVLGVPQEVLEAWKRGELCPPYELQFAVGRVLDRALYF